MTSITGYWVVLRQVEDETLHAWGQRTNLTLYVNALAATFDGLGAGALPTYNCIFLQVDTLMSLLCLLSFCLTVSPGPPLFSLTVQLLDPFPCRVEFVKDMQ